MIEIVIIVVLALAVLGLGGLVLRMRSHPQTVRVPGPVREVQVPGPVREVHVPGPVREVPGPVREVPGPERIKEVRVAEYVHPDDVPATGIKGSQLTDPQALPDAPGALPDSAVDGARLGELTVRAGAARGVSARIDGDLRHQVAEISVLDMLVPPALLSVVASGRRGARFCQVGAAETARSLHTRLAARASELDDLWNQASGGDPAARARLNDLLRSVTASLTERLCEVTRRRNATPDTAAAQFTCVVSRLGDTDVRQHLAFGVGAGPVLIAAPDANWRPVADLDGHAEWYLPDDHKMAWSALAQTSGGDILVLCTASMAAQLDRASSQLRAAWSTPPSLAGFLYQLGMTHDMLSDDRAAVCLWEGGRAPR